MRAPTSLELTVFLTGVAVMVIEILGARVLAPYFGSSLLTWTSIIGVILASLSIGYYYGGRWADVKPNAERLAFMIFLAGIFTALIPLLSASAKSIALYFGSMEGPLLASMLYFAMPSALLGIVSPYAVKLNTAKLSKLGASAGSIYAISTIGSIVGTFAAGFYLIPNFGTRTVLFGTSAVLLASPMLLRGRRAIPIACASIIIALFITSLTWADSEGGILVYESDSQYYHIRVVDAPSLSMRYLYLDLQVASAMRLNSDELPPNYMDYTRFAYRLRPDAEGILFLGLGAGVEPTYVRKHMPSVELEVVEVDARLLEVARNYFRFEEDENLRVVVGDARAVLAGSEKKYDLIRVDVFNSHDSIPFHLTTSEAVQEMKAHLKPDGLVVVNLVSALTGKRSRFFRAEYKTYRQHFEQVEVLALGSENPTIPQNIVLIASNWAELDEQKLIELAGEDKRLQAYSANLWEEEVEVDDVPILTDDYAPVESMIGELNLLQIVG